MEYACFKKYAKILSEMNRAVVRGYKAPHKVILLMSVCELMSDGTFLDNRIILSRKLEDTFKELWRKYIDSEEKIKQDSVIAELFKDVQEVYPFKCNIANPFYHLSREPFWRLEKSDNWRQRTSWSVSTLRTDFKYAVFDEELYELIMDTDYRNKIFLLLCSMI